MTTDIYTLGLLTFEMLVGKRACGELRGEAALEFARVGAVPEPSSHCELPASCAQAADALVAGSCEKNPKNRFQTMDEFLEALGELERAANRSKRSSPKIIVLASFLVVLFGGFAFGFNPFSRLEEEPMPEVPAQAQNVQFEFISNPASAIVVAVSDGRILGVTPLVTQLPRGPENQSSF